MSAAHGLVPLVAALLVGCFANSGQGSADGGIRISDRLCVDSAVSWLARPDAFVPAREDAVGLVVSALSAAGLRHVRDRLKWGEIEKTRGNRDFAVYRENVHRLRGAGIGVIETFHDAPAWTRDSGRPGCLPRDLVALAEFCRASAETLGDGVEAWEFWNEEDVGFAPEPAWDYAAALKAAAYGYRLGGAAKVLPGALCLPVRGAYDDTLYANGIAEVTDAINLHMYEDLKDYPKWWRSVDDFIARNGLDGRSVWITECGTRQDGDAEWSGDAGRRAHSSAQERLQAEFALKSQVLHWMMGAERVYGFVFAAFSEEGGRRDWGYLRRDGSRKPVTGLLKAVLSRLGDARLLGQVEAGPKTNAFLFAKADGAKVVLKWPLNALDWEGGVVAGRLPGDAFVCRDVPAETLPDRPCRPCGGFRTRATDLDTSIVIRADFDPVDFRLIDGKARLEMPRESGRLSLEVWNLAEERKRGLLDVKGGTLEGLPPEVDLSPRSKATFDVRYVPTSVGRNELRLEVCGRFGGRRTSVFAVPVREFTALTAGCRVRDLDVMDPARWRRNDSADSCVIDFDRREQAVRVTCGWTGNADRWVYPKVALNGLSGARVLEFEVRATQDLYENRFRANYAMLSAGDGVRSPPWISYQAPTDAWEVRRVDLSGVEPSALGQVVEMALGGNPEGRQVTLRFRNFRVWEKP